MTKCNDCGNYVSPDFARVMGDNDGEVHACPECSINALGEEAGGVN